MKNITTNSKPSPSNKMEIAVSLSSGRFIRAKVVSRAEIEDGITICSIRTVYGTGAFSAIHEQTGATVCQGDRARGVISKARDLILYRKGAFLASVANLPPAPPADDASVSEGI